MKNKVLKFIAKFLQTERAKPEYIKTASRKYKLALLIFFAATIMCLFPPAISVFYFHAAVPLIVLTGSEWLSVVSMLGAFYFVANVAQKQIDGTNLLKSEVINNKAAALSNEAAALSNKAETLSDKNET